MKIVNIKKLIRSILIILVIIITISLLLVKSSLSYKEVEYKKIYVSEGDTLWNIAKSNQVSNEYYKGKDIRHIINHLMKVNSLENSNINVNQELMIPIL